MIIIIINLIHHSYFHPELDIGYNKCVTLGTIFLHYDFFYTNDTLLLHKRTLFCYDDAFKIYNMKLRLKMPVLKWFVD